MKRTRALITPLKFDYSPDFHYCANGGLLKDLKLINDARNATVHWLEGLSDTSLDHEKVNKVFVRILERVGFVESKPRLGMINPEELKITESALDKERSELTVLRMRIPIAARTIVNSIDEDILVDMLDDLSEYYHDYGVVEEWGAVPQKEIMEYFRGRIGELLCQADLYVSVSQKNDFISRLYDPMVGTWRQDLWGVIYKNVKMRSVRVSNEEFRERLLPQFEQLLRLILCFDEREAYLKTKRQILERKRWALDHQTPFTEVNQLQLDILPYLEQRGLANLFIVVYARYLEQVFRDLFLNSAHKTEFVKRLKVPGGHMNKPVFDFVNFLEGKPNGKFTLGSVTHLLGSGKLLKDEGDLQHLFERKHAYPPKIHT